MPIGHKITVNGWETRVAGKRVVIDQDYGDDIDSILEGLRKGLSKMRPVLRAPIREILLPMGLPAVGAPGPACSNQATGQICIWQSTGEGDGALPNVDDRNMLEHEGAHLLFDGAGPPDHDEWNRAQDADGIGWVTQRNGDPVEILQEDWARSVELLSEGERSRDARFAEAVPERAKIVRRELGFP